MHICIIRAYRVCRDQHHLDIHLPVWIGLCFPWWVWWQSGAGCGCPWWVRRSGWVNVCWGAGGWVLLSPVLRVRLSTRQQSGGHWGCCCSPGLRVRLSTCQQNGCGCPQSLLPFPAMLLHVAGSHPFPGSASRLTRCNRSVIPASSNPA